MKVILFGATGMVGQSALRECLLDPDASSVLSIGRRATGHNPVEPRARSCIRIPSSVVCFVATS